MARILISTEGLDRLKWLEIRRGGIGGSDAAAVIGENKYCSRLSLWAEKTGRSNGQTDNPRMRLGRDLEEYVAGRFTEKTGKQVKASGTMYAHDDYEFIIANLDGEIVGENAGLECKTANFSFSKMPGNVGDLPGCYLAQCRHYINVMGYDKMYLAVLDLSSGELGVFEILRDEKCSELLAAEVEFWNNFIIEDKRPEPDGSDSAEETLKELCKPVDGECAELFDCSETADELFRIRDEIHGLEGEERRLRQILIGKMDGRSVGITDKYRLQLSRQSRTSVDPKLLKKDFPDVYEKCARVSVSNVFKIAERE